MNARSYKLIFVLLCSCVIFVIALQGVWIRSFYLQKTEAFDHSIYTALEKISAKLQERKNLKALNMTYIIVDGDTIAKTPSKNMTISAGTQIQVINRNSAHVSTHKMGSVGNETGPPKDSIVIKGSEEHVNILLKNETGKRPRLVINKNNKPQQIIVYDRNGSKTSLKVSNSNDEKAGMTKLLRKMMTEIKVIDTETENTDTLSALIKRALNNQGIFTSFEFSVQKLDKRKKEVLSQSRTFSTGAHSYSCDLSTNKLISTHDFLLLQFPNQKDYVMAGMKGSLILTFLFSLVIIGTFYFVLRLILNQKKLNEIKNDFINNMTHELKTPIATISLAVDNITHPLIRNDSERLQDYMRILKEENLKLNDHVERVLQMALLDKGELKLDKKPVEIAGLIEAAIARHALQIRQQGAMVSFQAPHYKIKVKADGFHLQTVFNNLLDNALKYASQNCIITITLYLQGDEAVILFKDNGIGIDAHLLEKIFERFYRVQSGNLHDVKGSGLGLSYVKSILDAHGASIRLQSEKGKGSEFTIRLKAYVD